MAQKPNFLKKLISASLVTASTAAFITGTASSAMGAEPSIAKALNNNLGVFLNQRGNGNVALANDNFINALNDADRTKYLVAALTDTSTAVTCVNMGVAKEVQNVHANRLGQTLANLRDLGIQESAVMASPEGGVAVTSGDEPEDNVAYGAWVKPFYTHANQSKKGGIAGYKAKTTGAVIGLDTLPNDNLVVGAAIGFTKTDVKHQNYKRGDKTNIDGVSFSLYGAQQLVNNFFAQGSAMFNVNHVKNKSLRYVFDQNGDMNTQIASSNYDNMIFGGNVTLGYDAKVNEGMVLSPMVGLTYLRSSDESYKEKGTTFLNKQVNSKFSDRTDLTAGAKIMGGTMNITDIALYPEAHAFFVHKVSGKLSKTESQLDGQTQPFISQPDKTAKTSYNLGLSISARSGAMEYGIGYDANIASKYVSHQGTLKVRVNF